VSGIKKCKCGRTPKAFAMGVAEDCMETWVACECGERGPTYEHWRSDYENAIYAWNFGDREPQAAALNPTGEEGAGADGELPKP
jgi:hypothetical protein